MNTTVISVFVFLFVLCFSHIHQGTIAADAIRYAHISQHMLATGNWLELYDAVTETLYVNKPPLLFWLLGISFQIAGFSTFAAKVPAICFAFLAALAFWHLGRRFFGERAGLFALLLLIISRPFFRDVLDLSFDGLALLGGVLCLGCSLEYVQNLGKRQSFAFYGLVALGVFFLFQSKIPYLALALGPIGITMLRRRRLGELLGEPRMYTALLPVAIFVGWWFLRSGTSYVAGAAENQFIEPFTRDHGFWKTELIWLQSLATNYPLVIVFGGLSLRSILKKHQGEIPVKIELLLWWTLPLLPIVLLAGPRPRYLLLPMLPLTLWAGAYLAEHVKAPSNRTIAYTLCGTSLALIVLVISGQIPLHRDDALIQYATKHPEVLNDGTIVCLSDSQPRRAQRLVKNSELLARLHFAVDLPIFQGHPLADVTPSVGQRVLANTACLDQLTERSVEFRVVDADLESRTKRPKVRLVEIR